MIWITKEQIIEFQEKLIRKNGGSFGLRDEGGLESCIYSPLQSFDGKEFYSSIIDKASRVSYLLVNNHPFFRRKPHIRYQDHPRCLLDACHLKMWLCLLHP